MRTSRWLHLLLVIGASASAGGCAARAGVYAGADPVVFRAPPTLVYVDSNVWVVREADYPVYYVDGYYWVYRDEVWYRSDSYEGGWARVEANVVPTRIVYRDHTKYVDYRGTGTARTRPAPRGPELRPASDMDEPRRARPHPQGGPPGQMRPPPAQRPEHVTPPGQIRKDAPKAPHDQARPHPPKAPPGQVRKEQAQPAPAAPPGRARPDDEKQKQQGRDKRDKKKR